MLAAFFLVPAFVCADGSPPPPDDDTEEDWFGCNALCAGDLPECPHPLPCNPGALCLPACRQARAFSACADAPCPDLLTCVCEAIGSPADDDTVPAHDSPTHHHSGCGIVAANPDLALFLIMTAIGVSAFAVGRRAKK
jgi:hypothetical protein